uniref:Uncharacterized protein n=1 Tax=Chelonoidis abingdonii TaxID=106734 RepID=A0A8C0ILB7_CHEAB
ITSLNLVRCHQPEFCVWHTFCGSKHLRTSTKPTHLSLTHSDNTFYSTLYGEKVALIQQQYFLMQPRGNLCSVIKWETGPQLPFHWSTA